MEFNWIFYLLLGFLGIICGIINILAGGGSNIILPLLMIFGLDPQTANATNRVGIWFQGMAGLFGFRRAKALPTQDIGGIVLPTVCGALVGAVLAAKLDVIVAWLPFEQVSAEWLMKMILLGAMLFVAAMFLFKPQAVMHAPNTELSVKQSRAAWGWLFAAGLYGSFVQAGVGFVLLTALAGALHYDLRRANALKLVCTMLFTSIALGIFIWQGQVLWKVGLLLALGNSVGALIGVRFALSISQNSIRWILFLMTVAAVIAALWF